MHLHQHYYSEQDIMMVGQSCINDVPTWTGWDWSKQRDHPDTVKDELGLKCVDPEDESQCPKARMCIDEKFCHMDQPDWSQEQNLRRPYPLGWGDRAEIWLDPAKDHSWTTLPEDYSAHLGAGWAVGERTDENRPTSVQQTFAFTVDTRLP